MPDARRDPYTVLGVAPTASPAEITTAYRRLVRELHPDNDGGEPDRLAAVIDAYRMLRSRRSHGTAVPVRVRRDTPAAGSGPDLTAGPVRRHPRASW